MRVLLEYRIKFIQLWVWWWLFVVVVQSLSRVWLFVTPWTAARQASLSFTISQSLLKLMLIELVMPSNHLILCRPLLLLHPVFPSIRVFSNEKALDIRCPKFWSLSFSISPSNEYLRLISFGYGDDFLNNTKGTIHEGNTWLDWTPLQLKTSALQKTISKEWEGKS